MVFFASWQVVFTHFVWGILGRVGTLYSHILRFLPIFKVFPLTLISLKFYPYCSYYLIILDISGVLAKL